MRPTQTLPPGYQAAGKIDLKTNKSFLVWMNIGGAALLFAFGWLFIRLLIWLRPEAAVEALSLQISGIQGIFASLAFFLVISLAVILLHEAVHGLFFWLFTGGRPVFAFRGLYASASAPGWYLPRGQYLVVALAPLTLLSLAGLVFMYFAPPAWLLALLAFLALNAGGAVGDLSVAAWLLSKPPDCLANDQSDVITLYLPAKNGQR